MDNELRSIANLIRQRQPADARRALGRYLKAHSDSAEAWYLLSVVETDADKQIRAAQKAAALEPKYGKRLAALLSEKPRSGRRWALLVAVPVLLMLVAIGVVWAAGQFSQPAVTLPTQAAFELQAPTITATEPPSETVQPSPTPATPTRTTSPSHTPTATQVASATITDTVIAPTNAATLIPVSATSAATRVPPTIAPPTANPTSVPVIATVSADNTIPLNGVGNIGIGQMLVIDALRQAGAAIQERGGSIPPAPAGEEWVLVELLLICAGDSNCTPDMGAFNITGSSGRPYPPAAAFQLDPVFNSQAYTAGQVWGYLGFLVPNSESGLWLTLGQGSAAYRFALQ